MRTGPLYAAINKYKFQGKYGWGLIFARVLLGYLYDRPELIGEDDLIIPSPTYLDPARDWRPQDDHTAWVVQQAHAQDDHKLPFVTEAPVVIKTKKTRKFKSLGLADRLDEARELRTALVVPDTSRVRGRRIYVYDDIFTTGITLNTLAGVLLDGGASSVYGLALARQPLSS